MYTEKQIIEGCTRNERYWQEILYRKYFPTMMRMVQRYERDLENASMIVNTGMLRVFQKIDTFEFKGSFEGWVRRLVFHAVSDHFKKENKYLQFMVFEEEPRDSVVKTTALDKLYESDLLQLIEKIPEASANVFKLYAIQGYTHVEIANMLNISEGTSKWHLSNARKKLQELLKSKVKYAG